MKNSMLAAAVLSIMLLSCSKNAEQVAPESNVMLEEPKLADPAATAATTTAIAATTPVSASPEAEGKALVEGADCLSCHKVDTKLVGPSYQDVAAKYTEADMDKLAQKVIDGGKGNWGEIPMTPHAGMSKEDASRMVKYILSLKK